MARESRDLRIRRLRAADYDDVVEVLRASGMNPHVRGRDSRSAFSQQLRVNRSWYFGAFHEDRLVGVVLGTHDTRKGWINRLAVLPDYRRRGIATRLVHACERHLHAAGIEMFAALVESENEGSKALFEDLGYEALRLWYMRKKRRRDV